MTDIATAPARSARAHVELTLDQILRRFHIPGEAARAWVEDGTDWLHIITLRDAPGEVNGVHFYDVAAGGYVEHSPIPLTRGLYLSAEHVAGGALTRAAAAGVAFTVTPEPDGCVHIEATGNDIDPLTEALGLTG